MIEKSSKDKLIDATMETIYINGLHSITTAKIAKEAKLSEAMIYRHFGSKKEMIIATFMEIKKELNSYVEHQLPNNSDFDTKSYSIWLSHIEYFLNNPKKLRVLNQFEHSNYMTDAIREECLKLSSTVIEFFHQGIQQNTIKTMHIEIAIALFFSPILSITESIIEKRIEKTDKTLKLLYKSTMSSIKK